MSLETVINALNSGTVTKSGYVLDMWILAFGGICFVVAMFGITMLFMKVSGERMKNVKLDTIKMILIFPVLTMAMGFMGVMAFTIGNQEVIADTYVKDIKVVKEDFDNMEKESFKVLSEVSGKNKGKDNVQVWVNDDTYGKMTLGATVKRDVVGNEKPYVSYRKLDKSLVFKKPKKTLYAKGWVSVELHVPKDVKDEDVYSYVNTIVK